MREGRPHADLARFTRSAQVVEQSKRAVLALDDAEALLDDSAQSLVPAADAVAP
jgi:hypothetical protein